MSLEYEPSSEHMTGPADPVRLEAFHTWMAALAEERADDLYRIKV